MNEVATITPQPNTPVVQTEAVQSLVGWSTELDAAYKLATMICNTSFVPQHFRGKPEETAVAMLYGHTLELPPMVAVKSIYVVHGTPALYAQTMYALALAKGHQIERVHADDERVEFRARRRGNKDWQRVEWTIERAKRAKYTSNNKYQENPIGMLTEKCKAEAAKLVAPDVLSGLYSVEEIELGDYDEAPEVKANAEPEKPKTTIKRRTSQAPAPDLPAAVNNAPREEEEPPADEAGAREETGEMCTPDQWTHLTVALKAAGYTTKPQMGKAVNEFLQRETGGPQDITAAEVEQMQNHFTNTETTYPDTGEIPADDADAAWLAGS